jgi:hypothetical protein
MYNHARSLDSTEPAGDRSQSYQGRLASFVRGGIRDLIRGEEVPSVKEV